MGQSPMGGPGITSSICNPARPSGDQLIHPNVAHYVSPLSLHWWQPQGGEQCYYGRFQIYSLLLLFVRALRNNQLQVCHYNSYLVIFSLGCSFILKNLKYINGVLFWDFPSKHSVEFFHNEIVHKYEELTKTLRLKIS